MARRKSILSSGGAKCGTTKKKHHASLSTHSELIEQSTTNSISRGVFCFKPGTFHIPSSLDLASTIYDPIEMPPSYHVLRSRISGASRAIQSVVYSDVLAAVSHFCAQQSSPVGRIPCCALLSGTNMTDRSLLFNLLTSQMQSGSIEDPLVASFNSMSVTQSVKCILAHVAKQLLTAMVDRVGNHLSNSDYDTSASDIVNSFRKDNISLQTIADWHSQLFQDVTHLPLVIIVEDFEQIPSQVIQDVILSLVCHPLPFVLIFGISTSVATVHKTLNRRSIRDKIQVTSYSAVKSEKLADAFVSHLCVGIDALPSFRLAADPLKMVMADFAAETLSVTALDCLFQRCLVEHFASSPLVRHLCVFTPTDVDRQSHLGRVGQELPTDLLDRVRSLPSVRRYIEADNVDKTVELLTSDAKLRLQIPIWLSDLDLALVLFSLAVQIVHFMAGKASATRSSVHYIYRLLLDTDDYLSSAEYRQIFQPITDEGSIDDLTDLLFNIIGIADIYLGYDFTVDSSLSALKAILSDMQAESDQVLHLTPTKQINLQESPCLRTPEKPSNRLSSRSELKAELKANVSTTRQSKKEERHSVVRQICSAVHDLIAYILDHHLPTNLPLAEVYFFDNAPALDTLSVGASVHAALKYPAVYLQTSPVLQDALGLTLQGQTGATIMPDVCLAYQLTTECGKFVNLHDWFQSWAHLTSPDQHLDDDGHAGPRISAEDVQHWTSMVESGQSLSGVSQAAVERVSSFARFSKCVTALQFVGLIQPTRRKLDHVTRIMWAAQ